MSSIDACNGPFYQNIHTSKVLDLKRVKDVASSNMGSHLTVCRRSNTQSDIGLATKLASRCLKTVYEVDCSVL